MPLDVWEGLLEAQGGLCAICNQVPETVHIDHNHACCKRGCTACVRALLCHPCNAGLGLFYDDPSRLLAAAAYLIQHGQEVPV
jgi:hypothetical protein